MSVIPFPPTAGRTQPPPTRGTPLEACVEGTFRSPRGRAGVMTCRVRLEHLAVADSRLSAVAVISGELREPDGSPIGVGSRRREIPASLARESGRATALIGPVEVDLMGLAVNLPAFRVPLPLRLRAVPEVDPARAGSGSR